MKLKNLAGFGFAAVAAISFAAVSTSAIAKTNHTTSCPKEVKCYGVNKSGTGYVLVTKSACEQIGGSTTNTGANTTANPANPANTAPSMTSPGATPSATDPNATNTPGSTPTGGVTTSNPNQ